MIILRYNYLKIPILKRQFFFFWVANQIDSQFNQTWWWAL